MGSQEKGKAGLERSMLDHVMWLLVRPLTEMWNYFMERRGKKPSRSPECVKLIKNPHKPKLGQMMSKVPIRADIQKILHN